ncbi:DNA polymerase III subunit delta [Herbiconiux moechotypicola]|uniref:DNA-directed DNA polymerase n=1 Tax=Herbiconiux moechotypicola TaxID=637393 RepID=A0ABP5QE26_9MICO|nr:DNA polymerase III subunit delta [Herbiconiux moechotypicola]MCS5729861.1 DNA polymerase III subunit delta [Herbiconiux moechotypicola]
MAVARGSRSSGAKSGSGSRSSAKVAIPQLDWSEISPAPVVLVSGTESFLAERAIRRLRDLLKAEDPSLEVTDIDASGYVPGELLSLASPSLFGEPRLLRVASVEKCTDAFIEDAIAYLGYPADDTYLVLRHGGGVRGKKLLDAVRAAAGTAIEVVCAEITRDSDRYDFAAAEFRAAGKRVTPSALRALVSAFTDDLAELSAACAQLASDSADEITEVTVARYYAGRVETNAFAVADAALAGHYGESLALLRHALASGADPVPIVAAFAMKLRTMAKVLGTRGASGQLAGQLGMAPWQIDRARRDLSGWSSEGLGRSIQVLADTDESIKGAGRDPVFALEHMLSVISARGTL